MISAFFVVLVLAIVGCLAVFGVISGDQLMSIALKSTAAIVLLGICAALIKLLVSGRKEPQDYKSVEETADSFMRLLRV